MVTCGKQVKKSLITFFVALLLSIGFTFFSLLTRASFSAVLQSNVAESLSINTMLGIFFSLIGLGIFFFVFYFLAKSNKILAREINRHSHTFRRYNRTSNSILIQHISVSIEFCHICKHGCGFCSLVQSLAVGFFFPALTALLFAELREKKSTYNLNV